MKKHLTFLMGLALIFCAEIGFAQTSSAPATTQQATSPLDKYAGVYKMDANDYIQELNFQVLEGVLTIVMDGQEPAKLTKDDSKENFFLSNLAGYDVEITFSGEGDAISKIEMVVGGGMVTFTGKK